MKKKLFLILFLLFPIFSLGNYTFTCLCSSQLSSLYENIDTFIIEDNLEKFSENLDRVEETLDKNILVVENDMLVIEEINKTLKLEIAQLIEYKSNLEKTKDIIFKRE